MDLTSTGSSPEDLQIQVMPNWRQGARNSHIISKDPRASFIITLSFKDAHYQSCTGSWSRTHQTLRWDVSSTSSILTTKSNIWKAPSPFKNIYLFICSFIRSFKRQSDREWKWKREQEIFHLLVHLATAARVGLGWRQEPGTPSWFHTWETWTQVLQLSSTVFQVLYQGAG